MIRLAIVWGVLVGTAMGSDAPNLRRFETTGVEMAVPVRLLLYAGDQRTANRASAAARAEIRRLDAVFSDYDPASEARRLCDGAKVGSPMHVSDDLFRILAASQQLSLASGGAFDVTVGPLSKLWRRTLRRGVLPDAEAIADARNRAGHKLVELDPGQSTVTLLKPRMRLDFGGIAKGYALDAALEVLRRHGITRALLEFGGDIRLGDAPPDRKGWRIGIDRLDNEGPPRHILVLANVAVATSGDASQHVKIDGRRYSHVVDPRSGIALADHGSVTVIAPNAMTADGLASAVSVLGPTEGLKLVEGIPDTAALIVRGAGEKREVFVSTRMRPLLTSEQPAAERVPGP